MIIQITILCAAFSVVTSLLIKYIIPDIAKTYKDTFFDEIEAAKTEVMQAEQNFNYATDEYIDAAVYKLKAAFERLNALIRDKKGYEKCRK